MSTRTYLVEHTATRLIAAHKCGYGARLPVPSRTVAEDVATVAITRLATYQPSAARDLKARLTIEGDDSRGVLSCEPRIRIKKKKQSQER